MKILNKTSIITIAILSVFMLLGLDGQAATMASTNEHGTARGRPSCSVMISPNSAVPGTVFTGSWQSVNDADGQLEYSCNGSIGSGTVATPSGSATSTFPADSQICTGTARNQAGQTATCSATFTVRPPSSCTLSHNGITGTVQGGNATLTIPQGLCPVRVSFSSYAHQGTFQPFYKQVLVQNITRLYGPGTYDIGPLRLACNWQTDLYTGPPAVRLFPRFLLWHDLIAYDFVEHQVCPHF